MRLFIAIDVPDMIKEHLAFLQQGMLVPGLRLVHTNNIHLTLNFLGERKDLNVIIMLLRTISFSSFRLRLDRIGFFPHEQNPSVVWVGLEDNEQLLDLQRKIDAHFVPEKSFKAHLTVARCARLPIREKQALVDAAQHCTVRPLAFTVRSFKLYKSTLTPIGPVYEVVETFEARR